MVLLVHVEVREGDTALLDLLRLLLLVHTALLARCMEFSRSKWQRLAGRREHGVSLEGAVHVVRWESLSDD